MKFPSVKKLVYSSLIAGIYAVLTIFLAPISYGAIQFRLSEVLVLLAFINPFYIVALTVGCFIANIFSPNGILDIIFGTLATFISVAGISFTKKYLKDTLLSLTVASLFPTIINGIIIGYLLHFEFNLPLFLTIGQVAFGEFVVVTIAGIPLYKLLLQNLTIKKILTE